MKPIKFEKANNNIYNMFLRAEKLVVINMPLMQATVYTCILLISWLGAKMIVAGGLTTGEMMSMLAYCMNILMSLMMVNIGFNKWFKFCWKLLVIEFGICLAFLAIGLVVY